MHCRGVISLEYLGFFLFLDIRSIEQSRIQSQVASDGDEGASKISKRDNHIMLATSLMPTKTALPRIIYTPKMEMLAKT